VPHTVGSQPRRWRPPTFAVLITLTAAVLLVAGAGLLAERLLAGTSHPTATRSTSPPTVADPPPLLPQAPKLTVPAPAPPASVPAIGYDVSHWQCRTALPAAGGFAIVAITSGKPLSTNPCLSQQISWARNKPGHAVYLNTANPGTANPVTYGQALVDDAVSSEHAAGAGPTSMWWLDVETVNTWDGTQQQNATVLDAMAARLQQLGARVGIYSTPQMWAEIAGAWAPGLPVWFATAADNAGQAELDCQATFAGSPTAIVQWQQTDSGVELDHNLICPAFRNHAGDLLQVG
jgi:hypothetical protein